MTCLDQAPLRVLMTGAGGYVGSRLLTRLASMKWPLAAVTLPRVRAADPKPLPRGCRTIIHHGRMNLLVEAVRAFAPDVVIHLAAAGGAEHEPDEVRKLMDANVAFGVEVAEAASLADCTGFVAAGTFREHGSGREDYAPSSLQAAAKRAFADVLAYYALRRNLNAIILKLTDVYGPDEPRERLMSRLLDAQASGVAADLTPGQQQVDLIHVDDVVDALIHAARRVASASAQECASYFVGGGRRLSVREVAALLEKVNGRRVPVNWGARAYPRGEVFLPWSGPALPGWSPRIPLEEGVAGMFEQRAAAPAE